MYTVLPLVYQIWPSRVECIIRIQVGRPENSIFFGPAVVTRLLTPRSQKSGYGLLLGCRSPLDGGHEKKTFFHAFPPQKTVKSSSDGRAHLRNRSGVVELVGREPWIIARVENGVTKFSPQRQKTPKLKKLGSGKHFSVRGSFIFLAAGKLTFFGGGV